MIPQSWTFGDSIDWTAPFFEAVLFVELPFWLMIPNSSYAISANDHDYTVDAQTTSASCSLRRCATPATRRCT